MAWITDAQLKAAIAMRKHLASASLLPDNFVDVAPRANASAYGRLRGVLLGRGFTAAEADAWDDRVQWNEDLGVAWAEWRTADPADRPQAWEEIKEMLEQLQTATILINGVATYPSGSAGRVGYGAFDTDDDTFTTESEL